MTKILTEEELRQETLATIRDIEEGNVVEHSEVIKWLKSWGTDNVLEMPTPKPKL